MFPYYLQTAFICDTLWRSLIKWSFLERNVHNKTINRSTIQKDKQFLKVPASDVMRERFLFLEFYLNFLDMGRRRFLKGGGKFISGFNGFTVGVGSFVDKLFSLEMPRPAARDVCLSDYLSAMLRYLSVAKARHLVC